MKTKAVTTRRKILAGATISSLVLSFDRAQAKAFPKMTVTKDPSCGCCSGWVEHIRAAGFPVEVIESGELNRVKDRLGVPQALASCHTAKIGGYLIEGHVPAAAVKRLLAEKPAGRGLAVPGMPVGSPGMEVEGTAPEAYDVVLFGPSGQRTFARFLGRRSL